MRLRLIAWAAVLVPALLPGAPANAADFYLKNGDRVVFYGDSITDQRLYTTFTETFIVTRFPKKDVTFVHSGWGGDRVTGGGGGPIDRRLARDVFAYKPTVMTIMLGMNDASYRAFEPKIFETYTKGFEHIIDSVKKTLPGIRITLIQPSPYDDVTQTPKFEGGYNAVLVRYGDFLKDLAKKEGLDLADLNTYVVDATKKAFASDPDNARKLNPGRVHPAPSAQLLMSAALLKAWNAPAEVSRLALKVSGDDLTVTADTNVSNLKAKDGVLSWTQLDNALPFPLNLKDPLIDLALRSSDFVRSLNMQPLEIKGLAAGEYTLSIDGDDVGNFTSDQFAAGVNLATLPTPMVKQAADVHALTLKHNNIHFLRWRTVEVPLQNENSEHLRKALDGLDEVEADIVKKQRETAQPKAHDFKVVKKG